MSNRTEKSQVTPFGSVCYLRTLRPVILLLPLLQDQCMRCRSSCVAMQRTIGRNGATSTSTLSEILRAHPIKPYQAWTPSSEMQVLPKSMLSTGLPFFNSWATAWICTKRGKLQKTTTSKQGGSHQHLTLNQPDVQQESTGHTGLLSNANSCILAT